MRNAIVAAMLLGASAFICGEVRAMMWSAQPIVVHEWGVQEFDWDNGKTVRPVLPNFIYTDLNPGVTVPAPEHRVKDLPPDSGMRRKPVLYFYLADSRLGENAVGVEMRFAYGHANAWYPQVNMFRTPDMTAGAKEPDWDGWRKSQQGRPFRNDAGKAVPVPDDPRMELVWSRLVLSKDLPAGPKLQEDLSSQHWISAARKVQSSYVTNGSETEKFLFYEGATHELPAIAVIPSLGDISDRADGDASHIVNVGDTPIYNVFAICRRGHSGWIAYMHVLEPINLPSSNDRGAGTAISTLSIPGSEKFDDSAADYREWSLTTSRLVTALTEGDTISINHGMRDPADPQGPCISSQLFLDEATALESIWHDDFFNSDGLTIVYQQSPVALDRAMPLNIYTDMYRYAKLSRCGLVLNKNVNAANARMVFYAVQSLGYAQPKDRDRAIKVIQANRFLAEGALAYFLRTGWQAKDLDDVRNTLDGRVGK